MTAVRSTGARVEELLEALRSGQLAGPGAAAAAQELVGLLVGLYGGGLAAIVTRLRGDGDAGARLLAELAEDPRVEGLLLLHDLHPLDTGARIQRALDRIRPYLRSHAGGVRYLGTENGTARLRLEGSCHGCASSSATAELAIRSAVEDAAPEVTEVIVEGMAPAPALLQIGRRPPDAPAPGPPDGAAATAAAPRASAVPAGPGPAGSPAAGAEETCELCAEAIPAGHGHLADLETSSLACACRACYLLFTQPSAGRGRYRAVPGRYVSAPAGTGLSAADWDELEIPVGLAFFLRSSAAGRVAGFYPSPAGVTECVADLAAWERLAQRQPLLRAAAPDVEAVLIRRQAAGVECYVVPVDACYELAGRMRLHWRGFDGGDEAKASIEEFLGQVRSRARPLEPAGTDA